MASMACPTPSPRLSLKREIETQRAVETKEVERVIGRRGTGSGG